MLFANTSGIVGVDPGPVVGLGVTALVYAIGTRRWAARTGRPMVTAPQQLCWYGGLAVALVAVAGPLDGWADRSLTGHMVQHVLLLTATGPLLALGTPVPAVLWALPEQARLRATAVSRAVTHSHDRFQTGWVAAGIAIQAGVICGWHLPPLYEAALHHAAIHDVEHISFVASSFASWWTVVAGRRSRLGASAVAALIGSMTGIILGSAMVIAPHPFYRSYIHGSVASALDDQRMAGVIMWAVGGLLEVLVGAGLFAAWLAGSRERAEESYVVPRLPGVA